MSMIMLDLLIAVRSKGIRFRAWAYDSFRKTLLHLKNEGLTEVHIDVSRSGLTAKTGRSQTIGLSYPEESGPGDHILVLESGQEKEVVFYSRCLNKREKPPDDGIEYDLVPGLLADYVAGLLREGADQQEVWNTIKSRRGEIITRSAIPARVDKF
jgi:hypothetical protein